MESEQPPAWGIMELIGWLTYHYPPAQIDDLVLGRMYHEGALVLSPLGAQRLHTWMEVHSVSIFSRHPLMLLTFAFHVVTTPLRFPSQSLLGHVTVEDMLALGLDELLGRFVGQLQLMDCIVCELMPDTPSLL